MTVPIPSLSGSSAARSGVGGNSTPNYFYAGSASTSGSKNYMYIALAALALGYMYLKRKG